MTDKELLNKLFEFEAYASARFDSEVRVAMAVHEHVKQMKQDTGHEITKCDVKRKLAEIEVAILDYNTRELDIITIENLGEYMKEFDGDKHHATEQALHDLGYDIWMIDFMT